MNIAEGADTFKELYPDMMKATRMLIINHDVSRYHSFDLLRYTLFTDREMFASLKPEYHKLIKPGVELAEQVQFMKTAVQHFNIYNMFQKDAAVHTVDEYMERVRAMLNDKIAKTTPTDVFDRFDVVFDKPGINGYLLQYRGEPSRMSCYNKLTVYEDANLLNLETAAAIIKKHSINAVMICSSELAVKLAAILTTSNYTSPMTFIIARYAYNFSTNNESLVYPIYNREMAMFELTYRYEFGFFDPFSGLTYRYRFLKESQQEE